MGTEFICIKLEYLKPYNWVQISCIKNSCLNLQLYLNDDSIQLK